MKGSRGAAGFTMTELVAVLALLGILVALAFTQWNGYLSQQRLRHGIVQVATDLRQAQERAKAERTPYTVIFTAASSAYTIASSGGGFTENTRLPDGVAAAAGETVTFSTFGQPVTSVTDATPRAYIVTVQNAAGRGTASVNATGGITYQAP
ncbi:MAG: general secretion pathway protein H, type IV fimbrial biogenesis protein FimT [Armatimonadetes bacterium CSP1-3]|nr:MAG: general secretion pathway protein H, type IV fimbrial biogenesis protein FimT [Armatimonadetes bacterium CSP1-3]